MALDTPPSSQVLDILFDEDNGVLSKELSLDGKNRVETLSFNDLDLLSGDLLDFFNQDTDGVENVFDSFSKSAAAHSPPARQTAAAHSDHDYYAHSSPGQGSDSGVSLNSVEQEDTCLSTMAGAADDSADLCSGQTFLTSSPQQSESLSPLSESTSDSSPLALEDFDFSTCMDLSEMDSEAVDLDTFGSSGVFSGSKDTDVSIDFDFSKYGDLTTLAGSGVGGQQHTLQTIKTAGGQQAIIVVDANTRQPVQVHRLSSTCSSKDSDSLPFTVKDVVTDMSILTTSDGGKFPELRLTDEEKELLAREGVTLPTNMPLTKEEERVLKAVRRKIRNKISAKESRKRKQGYVDGLERRVKICTQENQQLQKKVQNLEKQNVSLVVQLNKLKAMVAAKSKLPAQASTCVMVLLLSFALLVIPNISPFGSDVASPLSSDAGVRGNSRSLLGKEDKQTVQVSMFSEPSGSSDDDSDPYGVSSKRSAPWQQQQEGSNSNNNLSPYAARRDVPLVQAPSVSGGEDSEEKMAADGTEINNTDTSPTMEEGQGEREASQKNDLLFESELTHAADHDPPPAKRARVDEDGGEDL